MTATISLPASYQFRSVFSVQPDMPSAAPVSVDAMLGTWAVAWTRSRCEQAFVEEMQAYGMDAYCPLVARWVVRDAKKVRVFDPAFPGYAFVAAPGTPGDEQHSECLYRIRGSSRVCNRTILPVVNQRKFVRELSDVQRALAIDPELDAVRMLVPGRRVKIIRGRFEGITGWLERHTQGVVHLRLEMMQSSVAFETSAENIEVIEDEALNEHRQSFEIVPPPPRYI